MRTRIAVLSLLLAATGCTVVNTVEMPSERRRGELFVTAGDIPEQYETVGLVQVSRGGVRLFGFWDVAGTDLNAGFKDVLAPQIKAMGGDGAINVRFHQSQYTPAAQIIGLVFFFVPLPTSVTITGEVVKLKG
jgi:hypothetical protein